MCLGNICLGVGFVGFILKQWKYLVQILYDAIWMTSQYIMHCILRKKLCTTLTVSERGGTTVWWSGASDHTLWNVQNQDWENWWLYNKQSIGVVLQVKFQKLRPNAQNRDRIKFPLCSKAVGAKYKSKKEWSWMSSMGKQKLRQFIAAVKFLFSHEISWFLREFSALREFDYLKFGLSWKINSSWSFPSPLSLTPSNQICLFAFY